MVKYTKVNLIEAIKKVYPQYTDLANNVLNKDNFQTVNLPDLVRWTIEYLWVYQITEDENTTMIRRACLDLKEVGWFKFEE